ncbi:DUF4249 family protein [Candidatus Latescibacterota bacterium]
MTLHRSLRYPILAVAAAALSACGTDREPGELFGPEETGVLVVDAVLIVDQPLPDLFLRRTQSPRQAYSLETAAVIDARVVIAQGTRQYEYAPDPDSAGRYVPLEAAAVVQPVTRYELEVEAGGDFARAVTVTPGRLRIDGAHLLDEETLEVRRSLVLHDAEVDPFAVPENQVRYLDGLLELETNGIPAAGYQLALFSLDETSDFVIDADFLEEDDYEDFERQGASPPLAVENGRARLPWFAVAFAGPHLFRLYALDQNWFDYVRTNPEDGFQPGGLVGDQFERPQFSIEGGIGLFGSASVDSLCFNILPRLPE